MVGYFTQKKISPLLTTARALRQIAMFGSSYCMLSLHLWTRQRLLLLLLLLLSNHQSDHCHQSLFLHELMCKKVVQHKRVLVCCIEPQCLKG
jgi:hypothetical protein